MKKIIGQQRLTFLSLLKKHFNENELRDLFFSLDIDYESLPGDSKDAKARELFLYLERKERISELIEICQHLRQKIDWLDEFTEKQVEKSISDRLASFPIPAVFAHTQSTDSHWTNRALEIQTLTKLWHDSNSRIVGIIGLGGVGKSSLARRWYDQLQKTNVEPDGVFWWSFYYQPSFDEFLEGLLAYLTNNQFQTIEIPSPWARTQQLLTLLKQGSFLVVLDGLEVMQKRENANEDFGCLEDKAFRNLLKLCAEPNSHQGLFLITSRFPLTDLKQFENQSVFSLKLDHFSSKDGAIYLKKRGVKGSEETLSRISKEYDGHVLSLSLLSGYLNEYFDSDSKHADQIPNLATGQSSRISRILVEYDKHLNPNQKAFMQLLSCIRRPFAFEMLELLLKQQNASTINNDNFLGSLTGMGIFELKVMLENLEKRGMIYLEKDASGNWCYASHLIIREYFYAQLAVDKKNQEKIYLLLRDFCSTLSIPQNPTRLEELSNLFDIIYYSCRAEKFDEAITIFENYSGGSEGIRSSIIYKFGAYEFFVSLASEFFTNRDLNNDSLLTDVKKQIFLLNLVSYNLRQLGRLVDTKRVSERVIKISEQRHDDEAVVSYLNLAVIDMELGNLLEAEQNVLKGINLAQKNDYIQNKIRSFASLGWVYFLQGKTKLAQQYYQKADQIALQTRKYGLISTLGAQFSTFLLKTGELNRSKEYAKENLDRISLEKQWADAISYCQYILGDIAFTERNFDEAKSFYLDAL